MKILFVCTGNTCRSPMAEALMPPDTAESAGLAAWPDDPAMPEAVRAVAKLNGQDLSGHRARRFVEIDVDQFDWILTMNARQRDQILAKRPDLAAKVETIGALADEPDLEIIDPFGMSQDFYDQTAVLLQHLIEKILAKFDKNF
jgi:protein-tyrosine-phosphatase